MQRAIKGSRYNCNGPPFSLAREFIETLITGGKVIF